MSSSKVDPELLRKLWMEGKKVWEIAKIMNVSVYTIQEWRRNLGLPSRFEYAKKRRDIFKKLYLEGKTYKEISEILGVGILTLMSWRKKLHLPPRQKSLSPEEKQQREQQKLNIRDQLLLLVKEKGVVSFDEASRLLHIDKNLINEIVKKDDSLGKLQLCFGRSPAAKVTPTMVFGTYTAKSFVYLTNNLEALKTFLIKIIRENVKRPLNKGEVTALRYRLEHKLRLPKEMVDDILISLTYEFYDYT
jgi:transposase